MSEKNIMPQINLLTELPTMKPVVFNLALVMEVLGAVVFVLMSYYAYIYVGFKDLSDTRAAAETEQQMYQQLAVATVEQYKKLSEKPKTPPELTRLEDEFKAKNLAQGQIARFSSNNSRGFSAYFVNLSQAMIPGVWFKKMEFLDGGNAIQLMGEGISSNAINEVLERLVDLKSYKGRIFTVYRLAKTNNLVSFVATTSGGATIAPGGATTTVVGGEEALPDADKLLAD